MYVYLYGRICYYVFMENFLRKIWVVLFAFMIFGILAWVPLDKYQKSYMHAYHRIQMKPQEHLDNQYRYAEYIINGGTPETFKKITYTFPKQRYYKKSYSYKRRPYFIRDKHNPNIIYHYRGR